MPTTTPPPHAYKRDANTEIASVCWCPQTCPEFAFIGESNVGKSSIINLLTSSRDLAKVSKTPGKTKTLNHFLINSKWCVLNCQSDTHAVFS
eukprot:364671-Chlamydomonas_euryale.AAC.12